MKISIQILIVIVCSFMSTLLVALFPEEIYGQAHLITFIIECAICVIGVFVVFILNKFGRNNLYRKLGPLIIFVSALLLSLNLYPASYSPKDFFGESLRILNIYDNITLNDYKDSYRTNDVIMNNVVLHKFRLAKNLYYIKYLNKENSDLPTIKEYPVWIVDNKAIYENKSLIWTKNNNELIFKDSDINIEFRIGNNGLDEVSYFYPSGGSEIVNGKEIRESGVVDQGSIRLIVSKSNPKMEIENSYAKLMRVILKVIK